MTVVGLGIGLAVCSARRRSACCAASLRALLDWASFVWPIISMDAWVLSGSPRTPFAAVISRALRRTAAEKGRSKASLFIQEHAIHAEVSGSRTHTAAGLCGL